MTKSINNIQISSKVTDISAFESRRIPELLGRDYARHAETVVPGGLMFYCRCFLFYREISEHI